MGSSKSWAELNSKLDRLGRSVGDIPKSSVNAQSLALKSALMAALASVGATNLSGVGRKGANLGVRYNLDRYPDGVKSKVYATGPWQFIEADTAPHQIPRQRRRGRRRYAVIPGVGVRASAQHPGTKGKRIWEKTTAAAVPQLPRIAGAQLATDLHRIF